MHPRWLPIALLGMAPAGWTLMSRVPTQPGPSQPATIQVTAATPAPADQVELEAVYGHPRLLDEDRTAVAASPLTVPLPVRIELPEGSELTLVGHQGIQLRVASDSSATGHWQITGSTIRLRYSAPPGGKAHLTVLEAGEGHLIVQ